MAASALGSKHTEHDSVVVAPAAAVTEATCKGGSGTVPDATGCGAREDDAHIEVAPKDAALQGWVSYRDLDLIGHLHCSLPLLDCVYSSAAD